MSSGLFLCVIFAYSAVYVSQLNFQELNFLRILVDDVLLLLFYPVLQFGTGTRHLVFAIKFKAMTFLEIFPKQPSILKYMVSFVQVSQGLLNVKGHL